MADETSSGPAGNDAAASGAPWSEKVVSDKVVSDKVGSDVVGSDVAGLSFEEALAELERIVKGLEGGQQKLEDAIGAYERGAALRHHCETKLSEAEARVQAIVERADGSLALKAVD